MAARTPRAVAGLLLVTVLLVPGRDASACKEIFALIGGAEDKDYTKVEKVDDKLLKEIAAADPYDVLTFNDTLLCDPRVKDALATGSGRIVLQSVGDVRSLCMQKIQSMTVVAVVPTTEKGIGNVFPG